MEHSKISQKYNAASADSKSYFISQSKKAGFFLLPFNDYVWYTIASVDCSFDIKDLTEPADVSDRKRQSWKKNNPPKNHHPDIT